MELLPSFRFGILNGWLYLAAYFLGLFIAVLTFSPQKRKKLFSEPQYPSGSPRWFILMVGRLSAILFVVLSVFAELKLGTGVFYTGTALYALGYLLVLVSLVDFKRTPENKMVTDGLYRYSRNPQRMSEE